MRELYIIKLTTLEGNPLVLPIQSISAFVVEPEDKGEPSLETDMGSSPGRPPRPGCVRIHVGNSVFLVKESIDKIKDTANARFQLWKDL
jgi:hypothetical protein